MASEDHKKIPADIQSGIEGFDATKLKHTETEGGDALPTPEGNKP